MQALIKEIFASLAVQQWRIATAESLTAGLVSATLADVPGASEYLAGGVTTYQTNMKEQILGVSGERLAANGPVDPVVAEMMASGVKELFQCEVGISTTGVAGPGPAEGKPAGTVYICIDTPRGSATFSSVFSGDRSEVRKQTVQTALEKLKQMLTEAE